MLHHTTRKVIQARHGDFYSSNCVARNESTLHKHSRKHVKQREKAESNECRQISKRLILFHSLSLFMHRYVVCLCVHRPCVGRGCVFMCHVSLIKNNGTCSDWYDPRHFIPYELNEPFLFFLLHEGFHHLPLLHSELNLKQRFMEKIYPYH